MAKAISVHANEAQASVTDGPDLTTKQPLEGITVIVAVAGSYIPEKGMQNPPEKHDRFLALVSTENHTGYSHYNDESEQQREERNDAESRLLGVCHSRFCGRYMNTLQDRSAPRLYRNLAHFCATGGNCSHGPFPSTFPGDKSWTFATGEASFDAARMMGGRCTTDMDSPAPEVTDAERALNALEGLVRTAVDKGLGNLKVVVSISDVDASNFDGRYLEELQTLTSRVFDLVIGWVELGWVSRDQLEVLWRPFGTMRSFGVLGYQNEPPFVICDEE